MKLYRWLLPAALAVLAVLPGCKKNNNTETKYLDGYLAVSLPPYVQPGYTKTFQIDTMMTLSCPDGDPIGYYFKDTITDKGDTLVTADGVIRKHTYTITVPDELDTETLTFGAFTSSESAYSGSSVSVTFTIVRPGLDGEGSITQFSTKDSESFTDSRDGKCYYYTAAGGHDWMRQNLAWTGAGRSFQDCSAMTDIFGRYYTWEEAQTACPEGWRLPSDADFKALQADAGQELDIQGLAGKLMGDLYFNGTKMWEYWREVRITDELGLSAMPVGYASVGDGSADFDGLYAYTAFWTSDESDGQGVCRYIYQDKDIVYRGRLSKTDFAASVRCVKE